MPDLLLLPAAELLIPAVKRALPAATERVVPAAGALLGTSAATMFSERMLMSPKNLALYYYQVGQGCYVATGSKRVACGVVVATCTIACIPGAQQTALFLACTQALRGLHKMK
jgi:hypothetical protein